MTVYFQPSARVGTYLLPYGRKLRNILFMCLFRRNFQSGIGVQVQYQFGSCCIVSGGMHARFLSSFSITAATQPAILKRKGTACYSQAGSELLAFLKP